MAIKIVYTDVDGTMVGQSGSLFRTGDGAWTMEAATALVDVLSAGVDVVLVSGRNRRQLRECGRIMGIKNYISELGAEMIYDQGKEIVSLAKDWDTSTISVYDAITASGAVDGLFKQFGDRLEYHTPWSNELRYYSHLLRGQVDVPEANAWLAEAGYMNLKLVDNGQLASRSENLNNLGAMHAYHLLPESVDKVGALRYDMKRRGFAPEQAIALGDSWADVALAPAVGTFYLMKNGFDADSTLSDALAAHANIVVTGRDKSLGWADAVRDAVGLGLK